ncbi:hypothetical protein D3C80_1757420 [compost metagenome]
MQSGTFQLQRILVQRLCIFDDGTDMAHWRNQIGNRFPVPVGVVQAKNIIHILNALLRQIGFQIAVVHHQIGTALPAPGR